MLKDGSKEMRAMAEDAEYLGVVISDETTQKAKDFQDQMGRVGSAIKGVSIGITDELAPVMSGMAKTFANSLADNREAIIAWVKVAVTNFFTMIELIKQFGAGVKKVFTDPEAFTVFLKHLTQLPKKVMVIALAIGKFLAQGPWEGIKLPKDMFVSFGEWLGVAVAQLVSGEEVTNLGTTIADNMFSGMKKARESMAAELTELGAVVGFVAEDIGSDFSETFGINLEAANLKAQETIQGLVDFASTASSTINGAGQAAVDAGDTVQSNYQEWLDGMNVGFVDLANGFRNVMTSAIDNVSQGLANAIVEGDSMRQAFRNAGKQILKDLISMLIKLGIQRMLYSTLMKGALANEGASQGALAVGTAAANGVASWALAPWPLNMYAPAFGASMGTAAASAFTAGASVGATIGGIAGAAHGGMANVPKVATYLFDLGERVLSPNQNIDFTDFIEGGGASGSSVVIEELNVNIHTSASTFADIDESELEEFVAGTLIKTLDSLDEKGVRQAAFEREGI